ncbi:MAG: hypothetical protein WC050_01580 [Candidatus Paceibacterota bacterium]
MTGIIRVSAILEQQGLQRARQRMLAEPTSQFFTLFTGEQMISLECTAHRFMDGFSHFVAPDQAMMMMAIAGLVPRPGNMQRVHEDVVSNDDAYVVRREGGTNEINLMLKR